MQLASLLVVLWLGVARAKVDNVLNVADVIKSFSNHAASSTVPPATVAQPTVASSTVAPDRWSEWGQWARCSVTCGAALRTRSRVCPRAAVCAGAAEQKAPCPLTRCPLPFLFGEWSKWSDCSRSCGAGGKQNRKRSCTGNKCAVLSPMLSNQTRACFVAGCPIKRLSNVSKAAPAVWAQWGEWAKCSATCGAGRRTRTRVCPRGSVCAGVAEQKSACPPPLPLCPPPFLFGQWSGWTNCSLDCGAGATEDRKRTCARKCVVSNQTRERSCTGRQCATLAPALTKQRRSCFATACPSLWNGFDRFGMDLYSLPTAWSPWTEWAECSGICGAGTQNRQRSCTGRQCSVYAPVLTNETRACIVAGCQAKSSSVAAAAVWSQWGTWADCSVACGPGTQNRRRTCTGSKCAVLPPVLTNQKRACLVTACTLDRSASSSVASSAVRPVVWSAWGQWARCSVTCGPGLRKRTRVCPAARMCPGVAEATSVCPPPLPRCPPPFLFGKWAEWTSCSHSCGAGGVQTRKRSCTGKQCAVQASILTNQTRGCFVAACSIKPSSPTTTTQALAKRKITWSPWTDCSASCDLGEQKRTCSGAGCSTSQQSRACNVRVCVGNVWQQWSQWTQCSVSCGVGASSRARGCDGGACIGAAQERRACLPVVCAARSSLLFGQWTEWTACSTTCGVGGQQRRQRTCTGAQCATQPTILKDASRPCFVRGCPSAASRTPSSVSQWSTWSACNATCAGGRRTRNRDCAQADTSCLPDVLTEQELCNEQPCSKVEQNSTWSEWSKCSLDCGLGEMRRARECTNCGARQETAACSNGVCRSSWQEWSHWSPCSTTCGPGQKMRARGCTGNGCIGLASESRFCSEITVCTV